MLISPLKGKPLLLCIAALIHSLGALLAQHNEQGKENALYYLSRTLVGVVVNYTPIGKVFFAIKFSLQLLNHYFSEHKVKLISNVDPLKYILPRLVVDCKMGCDVITILDLMCFTKGSEGSNLSEFLMGSFDS